jgi:hypothetical protein
MADQNGFGFAGDPCDLNRFLQAQTYATLDPPVCLRLMSDGLAILTQETGRALWFCCPQTRWLPLMTQDARE